MKANEVKPKKWCENPNYPIKVLYDEKGDCDKEGYSIILGEYDGEKRLGVRWNGEDEDIGYPRQGRYPTWYVEPDFIAISIIDSLLKKANDNNDTEYVDNIKLAKKEFINKMSKKGN